MVGGQSLQARHRQVTDPPIVDPATLTAVLGGNPNPALVALVAGAASDAVAAVVDPPPDPLPDGWVWPDGVTAGALGVAVEAFREIQSGGAGIQLDADTITQLPRITSASVVRYSVFWAPTRAVGGMVG
jgi:hypothetical protein